MRKLLIILAAFLLLAPFAVSGAYALTLTNVDVGASGVPYNNWLTEYSISSVDLSGSLKAFCVENQAAQDGKTYEVISVPSAYTLVAKMADHFFTTGGLDDTSQSDYQIAIWHTLGMIKNGADYTGSDNGVWSVLNKNWGAYNIQGPIALAVSAHSQDYLIAVPVPEPATMLLFGIGLVGIAGFSRKKIKK